MEGENPLVRADCEFAENPLTKFTEPRSWAKDKWGAKIVSDEPRRTVQSNRMASPVSLLSLALPHVQQSECQGNCLN
jgi:hypothetical protein